MLLALFKWFADIGRDPVLAQAQALRLRRQIPLLYGLLLINSIAIAWSHGHSAPSVLTLSIPVVLFGATAIRLVHWMRMRAEPTPQEARRQLIGVTGLAAVFGIAYVAWSLALAGYGGSFERAHIALYVSTTVIGCIFCLTHLPQAAVVVVACVMPAFMIENFRHHHLGFAPIALNVLLVVIVLMRVLFNTFGSFKDNVAMLREVGEQHQELVRLNDENRNLALTDSLTGLGNRRSFFERLNALASSPEGVGSVAIGMIDLDRFKPVNDTFGHLVGDQLLKEVAQRLRMTAAPFATLYRIGGDEFGMIVESSAVDPKQLGERLCQAMAAPIVVGDRQLCVGASIGLAGVAEAGVAEAGVSVRELSDRADHALYHAKRCQPGTAVVFTDDLETELRDDQLIEVELRSLAAERDLEVHVQPIVDASTGRVVAGEVLVRWNSARLGFVDPQRFIAIAERNNLIHKITLAVVRRAVQALAALPEEVSLSVNVSACDLNSADTISEIIEEVRQSGIDAARLWIEVTETAAMRDIDAAIAALGRFRAHGMKVALDDFGTGYSSLSNLHRLPLDRVKIDRSFVTDLRDDESSSIAKAVIGLCKTLHLSCVAEGVESRDQAALLRMMQCDLLQGFLFSPAKPLDQFLALIAPQVAAPAPRTAAA